MDEAVVLSLNYLMGYHGKKPAIPIKNLRNCFVSIVSNFVFVTLMYFILTMFCQLVKTKYKALLSWHFCLH